MSRLRRTEIARDKKARGRWEERKTAWYLTLHDRAVAKCRATLESKNYSHPKKRDTLYGALRSQQSILFERRINMWMDLQSLVPPSLTPDKAKTWTEGLEGLDAEQELEHKQVRARSLLPRSRVSSCCCPFCSSCPCDAVVDRHGLSER